LMFFQLGFEPLEECEGIGGGACEPGEDASVIEAPDLARTLFDDDVGEGHLSVTAHCNACTAPRRVDGRTVKCVHRAKMAPTLTSSRTAQMHRRDRRDSEQLEARPDQRVDVAE